MVAKRCIEANPRVQQRLERSLELFSDIGGIILVASYMVLIQHSLEATSFILVILVLGLLLWDRFAVVMRADAALFYMVYLAVAAREPGSRWRLAAAAGLLAATLGAIAAFFLVRIALLLFPAGPTVERAILAGAGRATAARPRPGRRPGLPS